MRTAIGRYKNAKTADACRRSQAARGAVRRCLESARIIEVTNESQKPPPSHKTRQGWGTRNSLPAAHEKLHFFSRRSEKNSKLTTITSMPSEIAAPSGQL